MHLRSSPATSNAETLMAFGSHGVSKALTELFTRHLLRYEFTIYGSRRRGAGRQASPLPHTPELHTRLDWTRCRAVGRLVANTSRAPRCHRVCNVATHKVPLIRQRHPLTLPPPPSHPRRRTAPPHRRASAASATSSAAPPRVSRASGEAVVPEQCVGRGS